MYKIIDLHKKKYKIIDTVRIKERDMSERGAWCEGNMDAVGAL